ncbi:smoothelin-like protein 1 [Lissotriton helveticus]
MVHNNRKRTKFLLRTLKVPILKSYNEQGLSTDTKPNIPIEEKLTKTQDTADETPSPAEEPPSPAEEPPSPTEEPPSPAEETPSPAEEPPSPAEEKPDSAEDPSSPGDQISSPVEEERGAEKPPQEEAGSPETSLEEGPGSPEVVEGALKTGETQPDGEAQGSASGVGASAEGAGPGEPDKPPAPEKKKPVEKKRDVARSRTIPKSYGGQSRKAIMEKFGGPAAGPAPGLKVQRATSFGASSVKNMLLEWCKAKTRDYEHVDIQNFSSSWSSGMAFCALVHKFFPEEFDYATLDPKNRRQNFEIAFTTAEKRADCAQLLEVDDMVRMRVPDSKCVYTYIQELYRSLVQMGLVKTKKQ